MADMDKAQLAMDRAKYKLLANNKSVFLSTLLFSLRFCWDDTIPTACTNGLDLRVNPDFFLSIPEAERIAVLAHETWHVAFNHMGRLGSFNPERWNEACDHVINNMLAKAGYKVGSNWLCDPRFADMSAEEVYTVLTKENNPTNNPMPDLVHAPDPQTQQQVSQQVQSNVVKASVAAAAAGQGDLPGGVKSMIEEILNPPLQWEKIYQKYMMSFAKNDYSYRRPNRRFMPDYYLPSLYSPAMDELAIGMDKSGSVSDADFGAFIAQTNIARKILKPTNTKIVTFDTQIQDVINLKPNQSTEHLEFSGGGGTDPQALLDYFNVNKKPSLLVIFSDMDFRPIPIENKPAYPVLWVAVDARRTHVNFGTVIEMKTR